MMLAAQGHLEAATRMAQQAMSAHESLPMPFERARTQLLLGQLQRRQRQKTLPQRHRPRRWLSSKA